MQEETVKGRGESRHKPTLAPTAYLGDLDLGPDRKKISYLIFEVQRLSTWKTPDIFVNGIRIVASCQSVTEGCGSSVQWSGEAEPSGKTGHNTGLLFKSE